MAPAEAFVQCSDISWTLGKSKHFPLLCTLLSCGTDTYGGTTGVRSVIFDAQTSVADFVPSTGISGIPETQVWGKSG
jgi:hypothetical protein